jgi:hypothetical protein
VTASRRADLRSEVHYWDFAKKQFERNAVVGIGWTCVRSGATSIVIAHLLGDLRVVDPNTLKQIEELRTDVAAVQYCDLSGNQALVFGKRNDQPRLYSIGSGKAKVQSIDEPTAISASFVPGRDQIVCLLASKEVVLYSDDGKKRIAGRKVETAFDEVMSIGKSNLVMRLNSGRGVWIVSLKDLFGDAFKSE